MLITGAQKHAIALNEDGSFLLADLTAKVQETGETIDTTAEDVAKSAGIFSESEAYVPRLFIIGSTDAPGPVMEALKSAEVGVEKQVVVPPEQGYGQRDPTKVRILPLRRFANVRDLDGNSKVEVDGRMGTVRSITSGRVSVDFNPPLAGKTILYTVKVTSSVDGDVDKVRGLISRRFPKADKASFVLEVSAPTVDVRLPEELFYTEGLQMVKRALFGEITKYLKDVAKVRFIEEYSKKEEKKEEEKAEPKEKTEKAEAPKEKERPPEKKPARRARVKAKKGAKGE